MELTRRAFLEGGMDLLVLGSLPFGLKTVLATGDSSRRFFTKEFLALGSRVIFLVNHPDHRRAERAATRAVHEIFAVHETMTLFEPSPLTHLNATGQKRAVAVPGSLFALLEQARRLVDETEGYFDVTVGALTEARRREAEAGELGGGRARPGSADWPGVGMERIHLDASRQSVRLLHPATRIDLNGIAKGYAVDRAAEALRREGMNDFLVNAGGNIYAAGRPAPGEKGWPVVIAHPDPRQPPVHRVTLTERGIATSGNYQQKILPGGKRFLHLIDPRRGEAVDPYVSATVIAPSALEADAWSTAAFVGTPERIAPALQRAGLVAHLLGKDGVLTRLG
jgi:thiamine biosynthesis lipoprotein